MHNHIHMQPTFGFSLICSHFDAFRSPQTCKGRHWHFLFYLLPMRPLKLLTTSLFSGTLWPPCCHTLKGAHWLLLHLGIDAPVARCRPAVTPVGGATAVDPAAKCQWSRGASIIPKQYGLSTAAVVNPAEDMHAAVS